MSPRSVVIVFLAGTVVGVEGTVFKLTFAGSGSKFTAGGAAPVALPTFNVS